MIRVYDVDSYQDPRMMMTVRIIIVMDDDGDDVEDGE